MAELERLKTVDMHCKAWANLSKNLKTSIQNLGKNAEMETETKADEDSWWDGVYVSVRLCCNILVPNRTNFLWITTEAGQVN